MSYSRIIPLILAVALFMENMDSTVIATSLNAIANDIGTSPIALKLALTSYLVALAIFIPISSWMADKYGARHVFRWAIVVFVIGSIACAFSSSLAMFVGSRFLQGMLFGITPLDPKTFMAVSLMFGLVATFASYVPARRATKVDPMVALRTE